MFRSPPRPGSESRDACDGAQVDDAWGVRGGDRWGGDRWGGDRRGGDRRGFGNDRRGGDRRGGDRRGFGNGRPDLTCRQQG
jgi:hypothetical protein